MHPSTEINQVDAGGDNIDASVFNKYSKYLKRFLLKPGLIAESIFYQMKKFSKYCLRTIQNLNEIILWCYFVLGNYNKCQEYLNKQKLYTILQVRIDQYNKYPKRINEFFCLMSGDYNKEEELYWIDLNHFWVRKHKYIKNEFEPALEFTVHVKPISPVLSTIIEFNNVVGKRCIYYFKRKCPILRVKRFRSFKQKLPRLIRNVVDKQLNMK